MKSLKLFLEQFLKSKGQFVFLSLLLGKITAFLGSWLIIRMLPISEFGTLTIVASTFAIFSTFNGFGSQQSLLRFGSVSTENLEKNNLAAYLFRKGLLYQIILSLAFLLSSIFFINKFEDIFLVFIFFTIRLVGFYFFNHIQCYFRIQNENGNFAKVNNYVNVFGLVLLVSLTYLFGFQGYLFSIAFTPFISLFWLKKIPTKSLKINFSFTKKELFQYGIFASATALLSDLMFSADVLLLGFILNDTAVANYKVAILIPANITFLSLVFMQTDFPKLAKNFKNKVFLKHYIINYYKIFLPVCTIIFLVGFYFDQQILSYFFGSKYGNNGWIFSILLFAFAFNMLSRNLYGNLLSAVGKIKVNSIVSFLSLIILVILSFILVPKMLILGMAISISVAMIFSGVFFAFLFYLYYRKL
ncbi:oligosaccharide flippase family protein [Frigoriflavimonas asaccharolytica]|uniref:O-antigen/teichoic acid export membrane protein n=1 Tax=Frigoriflavimonas asaccharolytica TaxID=2735899 RepID=A0A8J8G6L5_9FLAO|nr:oligosaccharide flippase family protein [Frigoriflavimonas asaccharolytica]NRS92229.1 O-antigen/teichoic acid export membrane protein [Frigoriflavimonas asaccharolytica]